MSIALPTLCLALLLLPFLFYLFLLPLSIPMSVFQGSPGVLCWSFPTTVKNAFIFMIFCLHLKDTYFPGLFSVLTGATQNSVCMLQINCSLRPVYLTLKPGTPRLKYCWNCCLFPCHLWNWLFFFFFFPKIWIVSNVQSSWVYTMVQLGFSKFISIRSPGSSIRVSAVTGYKSRLL